MNARPAEKSSARVLTHANPLAYFGVSSTTPRPQGGHEDGSNRNHSHSRRHRAGADPAGSRAAHEPAGIMSAQVPFTTMAQVTADLAQIMLAIENGEVTLAQVHGMIGHVVGYTARQAARDSETPVINRAPQLVKTDSSRGYDRYRMAGGRYDGRVITFTYANWPYAEVTIDGRYYGTYASKDNARREILQAS